MQKQSRHHLSSLARIRFWYAGLLLIFAIFVVRLFYLQIIRHDHYRTAALTTQLKQYEVPAERGVIEAMVDDDTVPIVLNEIKYTLFADPIYVEDPKTAADAIARIIGGNGNDYEEQLKTPDTRYVVLAKKLDEKVAKQLDDLELKGIGTREATYRTYPQGILAAQLLGFVNDEGQGAYGIEEALNEQLKGVPGQLRAITDAQGVPLASNKDNIVIEPEAGDRVTLTIDLSMQRMAEEVLERGLKDAHSESGSILVIEAETGAVKAMANYPTYNPAEFYKVEDARVYTNAVVSSPLEVGSIMKPLTAAAALDLGVVSQNTSYYDPSYYVIDGATVRNIEEDGGAGTKNIADILQQSLNTGATWLLMQMGGGEINQQARERWHDYMTNHYQFGQTTGIEQGYEAAGTIPSPTEGFGLNIQYANTSFGQGMTATPLQMAAALASVINGGTYYQPHLVYKTVDHAGAEVITQPEVVRRDVVRPSVSEALIELMEYSFDTNHVLYDMPDYNPDYLMGGKTGTAEVARPEGGYYDDRFNGTFYGFIGGNKPKYVIITRVNEPKIAGYAGSQAAAPVFSDMARSLINSGKVVPRNR